MAAVATNAPEISFASDKAISEPSGTFQAVAEINI